VASLRYWRMAIFLLLEGAFAIKRLNLGDSKYIVTVIAGTLSPSPNESAAHPLILLEGT
jgi:hypothetical protein